MIIFTTWVSALVSMSGSVFVDIFQSKAVALTLFYSNKAKKHA